MPTINVISKDNGSGLSRNIRLLSDILSAAGRRVSVTRITDRRLRRGEIRDYRRTASPIKRSKARVRCWLESRLASRKNYQINLFMESLLPEWLNAARFNCLIPNPEWFEPAWSEHLPSLDLVLCKTRHAAPMFQALGANTAFTSFTSVDRLQPGVRRDHRAFLHVAGTSKQKGTATLVELWRRHPEWPKLTLVQHPSNAQPVDAPNIVMRAERLDDAELCALQNQHGNHVCPSEAEGFGHYLVEAASCQALVITTDGPPMNEHIVPTRGLLARYAATKTQCLATNYYVDPASLEAQIERAIAMPTERRDELCQNARHWFESNERFFRTQIVAELQQLVDRAGCAA